MALNKYLVSALMATGMAAAASSESPSRDRATQISSQSDADALQGCQKISGDIAIQSSVQTPLTFSGIQSVSGSFTAAGATNISSISAPSLTSIGDEFSLKQVNQLTSLSFPKLTSVGSITFVTLPNLQLLGFNDGINSAGSVSITDTGLTSLQGIELDSVGNFDLTANTALVEVNVNNIKNISGLLTISSNNNKLVIDFPNLVSAQNMSFMNSSTISVPSLANLTGSLGLFGNYISNFSAPNLTTCDDLSFDSNGELSKINLPKLETLSGGLSISNNGKLDTIDLPALATVLGAIDVTGSFSNLTLPSLKYVKGGFNAQSTNNFSCSNFQSEANGGDIIHGTYNCTSTATPTTIDGSSGSNSTSSGSSSSSATSSGAAVGNIVVPTMGFTAVLGALLSMLM
ncbi:GPI-anchored cell wall organization protein Ecm33 [Talaromyces proteolyticus]|uniref:GPI-anchored cell wall organization protein Ecm33 n=1 Tax=Talaromyces proteolyticus TaxID=1131652 RepID=A0AAD4KIE3_9EURO|nr:GPI-anchored cell wall organization protein Ecm33 [Talaromyces proteolyticus]KAH8693142.1 GPI-anchored cell wall organization protein Ecm33 [Talaromyces proteolyticus]